MKNKNNEITDALSPEESYLRRLKSFSELYLVLVIASGVTCAIAIVIALVFGRLLVAVALAAVTVGVYAFFSADESKKQLGLSFKSIRGRISLTRINAVYGDTVYIPSRLIWADVTEISCGALSSVKNSSVEAIYIPKSIERIGDSVFGNNGITPVIYYEGSADQWTKLQGATQLDGLTVVTDTPLPHLPKKKKSRSRKNGGEAQE